MGLTEEQVAELRRLSERAMKDIIRHGDDQETIEALQEGVIALLADRDSLLARVGELEAALMEMVAARCPSCAGGEKPRRNDSGEWVHVDMKAFGYVLRCRCLAPSLWDILKPKDPTDDGRPKDGDGGDS